MAIAHDASSLSSFSTITSNVGGTSATGTSATFSPPANSYITVSTAICNYLLAPNWTISNTGTALTWFVMTGSEILDSTIAPTIFIHAAYNASAQTNITVTAASSGMTTLSNTTVGALLIDVWTGTTNNLTLSQSNGGPAFNTNNFSGLVTTGYNLSRIMGIAAITSNVATSSTDVYTSFQTANISGLRTYSAINEAVAGNYYLNYQSAGGLQSRWAWSDSEIVDVTAVPGILYTPGFQGVGGALGSSNFVPVGQGLT